MLAVGGQSGDDAALARYKRRRERRQRRNGDNRFLRRVSESLRDSASQTQAAETPRPGGESEKIQIGKRQIGFAHKGFDCRQRESRMRRARLAADARLAAIEKRGGEKLAARLDA